MKSLGLAEAEPSHLDPVRDFGSLRDFDSLRARAAARLGRSRPAAGFVLKGLSLANTLLKSSIHIYIDVCIHYTSIGVMCRGQQLTCL